MEDNQITNQNQEPEFIICHKCGNTCDNKLNFCPECGNDLNLVRKAESALETDAELAEMNKKFAKMNLTKFIAKTISIASIVVFFLWLEYDIFEWLSTIAMLTFVPATVVWIVFKVKLSSYDKKMRNVLKDKTGIEL